MRDANPYHFLLPHRVPPELGACSPAPRSAPQLTPDPTPCLPRHTQLTERNSGYDT